MSKVSRRMRQEEEASGMRRRMDWLLEQAEAAEKIGGNIEHPIWTDVLKPLLMGPIDSFSQMVWDKELGGEEFKIRQAEATTCNQIIQYVESLKQPDTARNLRQEAEKILRQLEAAEEQGVIRKREPEGAHV